ncbi:MAG: hypothetical protein ING19_00130 [Azospirillum sp.]|nr:hypothetical protein [Azospirillum sp.]
MAIPRTSLVKLLPAAWSAAGLVFVSLVIFQPTLAIYMLIAGLPTAAIFMIDDDPEQRGVFSVGALNLAGTLPFVLLGSIGYLRQPPLWTTAAYFWPYAGAALGAALYFGVPMITRHIARVEETREKQRLSERQQALVEEWGPNVSSVQLDFSNRDGLG